MTILGSDVDSPLCAVRWYDELNLRTDSNIVQQLVDEQLFCVRLLQTFRIVFRWAILMRLDVITSSLSSIADITNKAGLDAAFLWCERNVIETLVKARLAVLSEKVFSDSSLNHFSVSVQILCYFGEKSLVEFIAFFGVCDVLILNQ